MAEITLNKVGLVITDGKSILMLENDNVTVLPIITIDEEGDFHKIITKKFKSSFSFDLKKHEGDIIDIGNNIMKNVRCFLLFLDTEELPDTSKLKQNIKITTNENGDYVIDSPIFNIKYINIDDLVKYQGIIKNVGSFIKRYLSRDIIRKNKSGRNVLTKRMRWD